MTVCSKKCLKRLWPEHRGVCIKLREKKKQQGNAGDVHNLFSKGGDLVKDKEETDFFLRLPCNTRRIILEYLDVESLCRTDSVMKGNIYSQVAWQNAMKGIHSLALSRWMDYSNVDNFRGLVWAMNRRLILSGISIREIIDSRGVAKRQDIHQQFFWLCESEDKAHHQVAEYIVKSGFFENLNKASDGRYTPIFTAAEFQRLEVLKACIDAGGSVNQQQHNSFTALYFCAQTNKIESVRALLEAGADPNIMSDDHGSPLLIAAEKGNLQAVKLLLEHGADVRATLGFDPTKAPSALHLAAYRGYVDVVRALLEYGAPVDGPAVEAKEPEKTRVEPPYVGVAYRLKHPSRTAVLFALAEAGADVNYVTKREYFPDYDHSMTHDPDRENITHINALVHAVSTGDADLLRTLIRNGVDIDDFLSGRCHYAPKERGLPQKAKNMMAHLRVNDELRPIF